MKDKKKDVVIVGAGPTGLALACALASHGIDFQIIDSAPGPERGSSRATTVHAATLELLDRFDGLGETLVARGAKARHSIMWSGKRPIARVLWERLPTPYAFLLNLPQEETERTLRTRLEGYGHRISWQVEATGVSEDSECAAIDAATPNGPCRLRARFVAGCDGARSAIRRSLGMDLSGKTYRERFLLADVHLRTPLDRAATHVFVSTRGVLGIMPMPGGGFRLNGTLGDEAELDEGSLRRMLSERGAESVGTELERVAWASDYRTHRRLARAMRVGRVFLAGDAAHLNSPVGGQGMNLGIQDAYNLGWKLAYVLRGLAPGSLLDSYEPERRSVAQAALAMAERSTRMIAARNPVERTIRNRVMAVAHRLPPVQRRLTWGPAGLLQEYSASDPHSSRRHGRLRAGARFPNVDLGNGWLHRRLENITYQLLLFGSEKVGSEHIDEISKLLSNYGPAVRLCRLAPLEEERVAAELGIERPAAALVRPDGFLAWIGAGHAGAIGNAVASVAGLHSIDPR